MPKRILIFSLTYFPFTGGAEVAVREITNRTSRQDIEFDMVTLQFDSALARVERVGNVTVHRVGFGRPSPSMADLFAFPLKLNKYLFPVLAYRMARRLHRRQAYDAIWSIMANYAGFGALFFKLRNKKVPFLLTLQEGDPVEHIKRRVRFVSSWFKKIFLSADVIQAISKHLADFGSYMGHTGKVAVIPNGVDTELFSQQVPTSELDTLRRSLGLEPHDMVLITTSRLVEKNGVDDCIKALAHLSDNVKLVVVGAGPLEKRLKLLAVEFGVERRVIFTGSVEHHAIPRYLKLADVFVRPSRSEGMGNSFIEAMAAGLPVVATQVGGIVDFLFDPDMNRDKKPTGLFAEVRSPESLARQVKRLLDDDDLRSAICSNAEEMVSSVYEWDTIARRMKTEVFAKIFI
ncbi:MAG: glycosyltransferase family 4 protein [Patescibacteria group bacterium]